jgi:hypothetical protein
MVDQLDGRVKSCQPNPQAQMIVVGRSPLPEPTAGSHGCECEQGWVGLVVAPTLGFPLKEGTEPLGRVGGTLSEVFPGPGISSFPTLAVVHLGSDDHDGAQSSKEQEFRIMGMRETEKQSRHDQWSDQHQPWKWCLLGFGRDAGKLDPILLHWWTYPVGAIEYKTPLSIIGESTVEGIDGRERKDRGTRSEVLAKHKRNWIVSYLLVLQIRTV